MPLNKRKYKSNKAHLLPLKVLDNEELFYFDEIESSANLTSPMGRPQQDETKKIITDTQLNYQVGQKVQITNENKPRIITGVIPRPQYQKNVSRKQLYDYEITLT